MYEGAQTLDGSGLPRAVGSEQSDDFATGYAKTHTVDCNDAFATRTVNLRQISNLENIVCHAIQRFTVCGGGATG
jgi:hypothetical protein